MTNQDINLAGDHKPILPESYEENEEWVKKYREQFGMDPTFF